MISIRIHYQLAFDHFEIPAGTTISVPANIATIAVSRGIAEYTEPIKSIVHPEQTRTEYPKNRGYRKSA